MTDADLLRLYDIASTNAAHDNLTGLTAYHRKIMFQIREGDPQLISNSIVRAESQGWHYNLSIVEDAMYDDRLFDTWYLSFIPQKEGSFEGKTSLLDLRTLASHPALAQAIQDPMFKTFFDVFTSDIEDIVTPSDDDVSPSTEGIQPSHK
jgi:hypothetical protein